MVLFYPLIIQPKNVRLGLFGQPCDKPSKVEDSRSPLATAGSRTNQSGGRTWLPRYGGSPHSRGSGKVCRPKNKETKREKEKKRKRKEKKPNDSTLPSFGVPAPLLPETNPPTSAKPQGSFFLSHESRGFTLPLRVYCTHNGLPAPPDRAVLTPCLRQAPPSQPLLLLPCMSSRLSLLLLDVLAWLCRPSFTRLPRRLAPRLHHLDGTSSQMLIGPPQLP